MRAKIVKDIDDLKDRGDILPVHGDGGRLQLIIVCPGCGERSGSAGKHVFNPMTVSYHPSIIHNKKLGGCGWHGWLKNGEFKQC